MAIKFKYRIPENLQPLVNKTIIDYNYDYLYGIMLEEFINKLEHCSLYLVCEFDFINRVEVWKNPIAIVAPNETRAVEIYTQHTKKYNGSVLCEIVNRCDKIKVEAC